MKVLTFKVGGQVIQVKVSNEDHDAALQDPAVMNRILVRLAGAMRNRTSSQQVLAPAPAHKLASEASAPLSCEDKAVAPAEAPKSEVAPEVLIPSNCEKNAVALALQTSASPNCKRDFDPPLTSSPVEKKRKVEKDAECTTLIRFLRMPEWFLEEHFELSLNKRAWELQAIEEGTPAVRSITPRESDQSACVEFVSVNIVNKLFEFASKQPFIYEECELQLQSESNVKPKTANGKVSTKPTARRALSAFIIFSKMPDHYFKLRLFQEHFELYLNKKAWLKPIVTKGVPIVKRSEVNSAQQSSRVEFISAKAASDILQLHLKDPFVYEGSEIHLEQELLSTAFLLFSEMPKYYLQKHFEWTLNKIAVKASDALDRGKSLSTAGIADSTEEQKSVVVKCKAMKEARSILVEFLNSSVAKNIHEYFLEKKFIYEEVEISVELDFSESESSSPTEVSACVKISNLPSSVRIAELLTFLGNMMRLYDIVNNDDDAVIKNFFDYDPNFGTVCVELKSSSIARDFLSLNNIIEFKDKCLAVTPEPSSPHANMCHSASSSKNFNSSTLKAPPKEWNYLSSSLQTEMDHNENEVVHLDRDSFCEEDSYVNPNNSILADMNGNYQSDFEDISDSENQDKDSVSHKIAKTAKFVTLNSETAISAFLHQCVAHKEENTEFKPSTDTYVSIVTCLQEEHNVHVTIVDCRKRMKQLNTRFKTEALQGITSTWPHRFDMALLKNQPLVFGRRPTNDTSLRSPLGPSQKISGKTKNGINEPRHTSGASTFSSKALSMFTKGAVMPENAVRLLISLRTRLKNHFDSSSYRNAFLWKAISKRMVSKGYYFSPSQCEGKMERLIAAYKDYIDGGKATGAGHEDFPFYEELNALLGDDVTVKPLLTLAVGSSVVATKNDILLQKEKSQSKAKSKKCSH